MTDLSGIARQLRLSVEQIRIAADLLEQGYQPAFIAQYRADESGCLSREALWGLKLEIDRQQRLANSRVRLASQLPKDSELDEEAKSWIEKSRTELDIEAALRSFRARRTLAISQERDGRPGQLLEKLIAHTDGPIDDLVAWTAEQLSIDAETATQTIDQTQRLIGSILVCDTDLSTQLRGVVQRRAQVRVELCTAESQTEAPAKAAPPAETPESASEKKPDTTPAAAEESKPADVVVESKPAEEAAAEKATEPSAEVTATEPAATPSPEPTTEAAAEAVTSEITEAPATESPAAEAASTGDDVTPAVEEPAAVESAEAASKETVTDEPAADTTASDVATETPATETPATETPATETPATETPASETPASETPATETPAVDKLESFKTKSKTKSPKKKKAAAKAKPAAKLTPRQRRRRWLIAMLNPMKTLKRPLTKLTAYQQLMLGRGRRSQIVQTHLEYDTSSLVAPARDRFVRKDHPLAKWFNQAVQRALDEGVRSKAESDAVAELEELAAEKLLTSSADGLRKTLLQRPIRGHRVMVVDTVGPKAAAIAIVDQTGSVLATEEIPCSALPATVNSNVMRLGELAHKYKVTVVALTNGPSRRFLVHTLRELVKQSSDSGLRWTMADRSGADAYAAGRTALRELSAFNRRDRAAIWVARSLQDPLTQYLKVGINRLRLGSYQRELPQEPLKKLVRETIADCVAARGVDVHSASVAQLLCVPGVLDEQAQQIASLAAGGSLESREQMLESVTDWTESQSRQAIGMLRIFGSPQTLDATAIHPEDYRLAQRMIDGTDLVAPPEAPEGWEKPDPISHEDVAAEAKEASADTAADSPETGHENESPGETPAEAESPSTEDRETAETTTPETPVEATATEPAATDAELTQEPSTPVAELSETVKTAEAEAAPTDPSEAKADAATPAEATDQPPAEAPASEATKPKATAPSEPMPKPEYPEDATTAPVTKLPIDVEKLARGWQVGREKLRSVASALHAPFADARLAQAPVPMLTEMPTLDNLEPGQCLWAVIVGVADFGAFVELGPECSGLIHISRLSDKYIEDPHEFVQVGDLVMTWVVSVDNKKGRVALTALSPQQRDEAEKSARESGQNRERSSSRNEGNRRPQGGGNRDSRGSGGQGRGQSSQSRGPGAGRGGQRGGDRRGGGGGGRGRSGGGGRPTKPVIVKSKKPVAKISSAMKEGAEPLRTFGDLMQFYEAKRTDDVPPPKAAAKATKPAADAAPESPASDSSTPSQDAS